MHAVTSARLPRTCPRRRAESKERIFRGASSPRRCHRCASRPRWRRTLRRRADRRDGRSSAPRSWWCASGLTPSATPAWRKYAQIVPGPGAIAQRPARLAWEQTGLPLVAAQIGADADPLAALHDAAAGRTARGRDDPRRHVLHRCAVPHAGQDHVLPLGHPHRAQARRPVHRAVATPPATSSSGCSSADPDRIDVAYHGVDHTTFRPPSEEEATRVSNRLGLHGQPYIAFLSTLEPRKNVPNLIRGWVAAVGDRDAPPALVLAGGAGLGRRGRHRDRRGAEPPARAAAGLPPVRGPARLPRRRAHRGVPEPRRGLRPAGARGDGLPRAGAHDAAAVAARGRRRRGRLHRARPCVDRAGDLGRCSTTTTDATRSPRPATSGRCSSPGKRAPRCTSRPTPGRSTRRTPVGTPPPASERHPDVGRRQGTARCASPSSRSRPASTCSRFLDTLETATTQPYEVVLADNGSTDGAPEAAAAAGRARLLRTGGNLGYGAASNRAVAGAASPWVVVANPDVAWTARLARRAARRRRAAGRGPARSVRRSARRKVISTRPRAPGRRSVAGSATRWSAGGGRRTRGPPTTGASAARRSRNRSAGCPARASCCAARRSRRSAASTSRTSCSWRTSTSAIGSPRPAGSACTRRARWSSTPAATAGAGRRPGCSTTTTAAPTATCRGATPGSPLAPLRAVIAAGLAARFLGRARRPPDRSGRRTGPQRRRA